MNQEQLQQKLAVLLQHTPLPERMGNFECTRAPQHLLAICENTWLLVEYRHLSTGVLFQAVLEGDTVVFQTNIDGHVSPLGTATLEEIGHVLRSDLLLMLEDVEDE